MNINIGGILDSDIVLIKGDTLIVARYVPILCDSPSFCVFVVGHLCTNECTVDILTYIHTFHNIQVYAYIYMVLKCTYMQTHLHMMNLYVCKEEPKNRQKSGKH